MNERLLFSSIESMESDASLLEERQFHRRTEAIDFMEFHIIDRIDLQPHPSGEWLLLRSRAEKLKSALEQIDISLSQRLRTTIRDEGMTGAVFKNRVGEYVGSETNDNDHWAEPGYDNLDVFINRLFFFGALPQPAKDLEPEMVYYQKTPARIVFDLVRSAHFTRDDVFVDIGCGMGHVAFLVHLLAGITVKGIELEPAFCDYARNCAAELHLSRVTFINADARQADYSDGTLFFMYTPFSGTILREVLDLLRRESLRRSIKIITYGPCTAEVAGQSWLKRLTPDVHSLYAPVFFHSL
jgi:SAM-dependent methyltransferase